MGRAAFKITRAASLCVWAIAFPRGAGGGVGRETETQTQTDRQTQRQTERQRRRWGGTIHLPPELPRGLPDYLASLQDVVYQGRAKIVVRQLLKGPNSLSTSALLLPILRAGKIPNLEK